MASRDLLLCKVELVSGVYGNLTGGFKQCISFHELSKLVQVFRLKPSISRSLSSYMFK